MARPLVECVPNFSEGRDPEVIEAIAEAIRKTGGVELLDVDPGSSTNRTVYTFVGPPDAVVEAAVNAAAVAKTKIDMTKHKGEHPRLGAMDVCPIIPVRDVTVEDCIACAKKIASALATQLSIPIYLYGYAATLDYRKTVPQIRAGEYEALRDKISTEPWKPDYGPAEWVPEWGATMVGVRNFLIAYNVNLLATKEQAHRIALNIRESGRGPNAPGRLRAVQGVGWWLAEANLAQVSLNLIDYKVTPIHIAYEEVLKDAKELNVGVVGSEIVGLVPLDSILEAAEFYIKKDNLFVLEEDQKVKLVLSRLGLKDFDPKKRIIEYCLEDSNPDNSLIKLTAEKFVLSVGARTPAPGGGSVSAYVAALGAGLSTMVGLMTYGKKQWESLDSVTRKIIPKFHEKMMQLLLLVDEDTNAFNDYMKALTLPKTTDKELEIYELEIQKGLLKAIEVPHTLAEMINSSWSTMRKLAAICNIQTASDLQVGAKCLETGVFGAHYNIMINLKLIKNQDIREQMTKRTKEQLVLAEKGCREVLNVISARMWS
ncbi:formimidoyltransferase-cyclodeaminase [Nilaparvata lugens]|uniref:formimidoyltransferase-cyclodeaminase n=1 Tax=Nilaparvata lugens TaxID=108931 RepID=UPI00193DD375|nr:formimidoyltransferase-cyclodeaminase [Nilaparvata lugens]